ncbi:hypothetical protein LshimejAT787_0900340 [Lyophyllum shimeji]|uniref:DUF6699 domain-containing protein n=1 Tax=Lyophyllum shimeji TaxID=47721 RepID=A0A9P3PSL1_LYOSH|nr:hypothetical protein LshimejAT787_0900340 [Lyophyllum shimeji]
MTLYDDMPPGIEVGGGGFIPPPPGASQGGQPYNPFPGASAAQSSSAWPPAPAPAHAPPWSANAAHAQAPPWFSGPGQHAQAFPSPPATAPAQSWAYGQPPHPHYPSFTPQSGWSAPTPAGSWGDATPAGSWGPPTPASANAYAYAHHSPWVNPQPGVGAQESTFGQPITASPWFSGGGVTLGAASPGFGGDTQGQAGGGGGGGALALVRKNSRHSHPHPHGAQNDYPNPTLALQRTMSHEVPHGGSGSGFPLHRTMSQGGTGTRSRKSSGNLQPFSLYQQMQDEQYSTQNLARRPRDWRPDYDPRAGLASYIPRVPRPRSDVIEWHDPMKRTPHEYLAYKPHQPPIYLDLRFPPPLTLEFLQLRRAPNQLDFAQLATQPAAQGMRLVHPLLPWYIDVVQSHENGITVHDVVWQMCVQLDVPIQARHWYNEELDAAALEKMNRQFQLRTAGNPEEAARGVKRVDFLRGRVVFEGLVRTRNGLWEMKTRKWEE